MKLLYSLLMMILLQCTVSITDLTALLKHGKHAKFLSESILHTLTQDSLLRDTDSTCYERISSLVSNVITGNDTEK